MDPKLAAIYAEAGIELPTSDPHAVDDFEHPLSERMKPLGARNWRMEGNELICDTDFGPFRQRLATDIICHGTGEDGLPILKRISS